MTQQKILTRTGETALTWRGLTWDELSNPQRAELRSQKPDHFDAMYDQHLREQGYEKQLARRRYERTRQGG